ncbi:hypothetical protein CMUS01_05501 [Colletotrichum musicola]|uniref:Uncharacterized protein n=1 Tax=Colletotrichum musicola TaxID=2175873 RepID=A0A8H6KR51_9PEZI|nr:hypothetical protein CMUS01_05501 [Colletotrichum musicola]
MPSPSHPDTLDLRPQPNTFYDTPDAHHDVLFPLRERFRSEMAAQNDITDLKASARENAAGVYAYGQRQMNRVVSFDTRQQAYGSIANLAQERPLLFAFLLSQLVFSSLPVILFSAFALSTAAFAVGAAVVFALFWIGIALLVLVPTLFFTCSVGILVWVWAAGSFLLAKWLYEMSPVSARGVVEVDAPNGSKYAVVKNEDGVDAQVRS